MSSRSIVCSGVALAAVLTVGACPRSSSTESPDEDGAGPVQGDPAEQVIANEPQDADAMQEAEADQAEAEPDADDPSSAE